MDYSTFPHQWFALLHILIPKVYLSLSLVHIIICRQNDKQHAKMTIYLLLLVFVCVAILGFTNYQWVQDGRAVDEVYFGVREDCHTLNIGLNENCTDVEVFQYNSFETDGKAINTRLWARVWSIIVNVDQLRNCKNHFTEKNRGLITYYLNFTSPSLNDTGEYVCSNFDGDVGTTIFIAVGKQREIP